MNREMEKKTVVKRRKRIKRKRKRRIRKISA
jgi:hypothetical protein